MASVAAKPNLFKRGADRLVEYVKTLAHDYRTVIVETAQDSVKRPVRTSAVGAFIAFLGYANRTRPLQNELDEKLVSLRQQMTLLPLAIHSSTADASLHLYTDLLNSERLDLYDCWFFSLLIRREFDRRVFSPVSQDSNLKKWFWQRFTDNFLDIGAFGKFYNLERTFVDYDIRQEEFVGKEN
ncbi:unnamed protein product [Bursaphelenchus okinawaensis]|uniref:Uncharacterized protein n=1 Tax=Bursaphelenchus okinawaensis TaxID=465554 RepID=A0A811LPB6_9BILA|nr:unnamed protein product [Bursaphelenchus okinawaensis]CAG9126812.1 unnamed protein product [Bursaphelenchus okinawaensis]